MRFSINREQFLNALLIANHAISSKASNAILLNFKLEVTNRGLEVTGCNGDITIWTLVPNELDGVQIVHNVGMGSILVNAKRLSDIVKKLSGDVMNLDVIDGARAKIADGISKFSINCAPADEYPDIDMEKGDNTFALDAEDFTEIVSQTAFAALDKDARPALTAVNFKAEGGHLIAMATDSARLSRKTAVIDESLSFSVNVPARILTDVVSMLGTNSTIELSASSDRILFNFGSTLVTGRLIAGSYPISSSIIPQNFNYFLEVNSAQLLGALDRISTLAVDRTSVVQLSMNEESVEISASNAQTETGVERLTAYEFTGNSLAIAFNATLVIQAVKALDAETVVFSFIGEMNPFTIRNPKDDSIVELITPMRYR